jgi:hypothetical protein
MFTATMRVSAHQTVADGDYRLARDPLHDDCFRDTPGPVLADTRLLPGQERRLVGPFDVASRAGHRIAHQTVAHGDYRRARDPLHDDCCRGTDTPGIAHQTVADGDYRRARDPLHDDCCRGTDTPGIAHQTVADGDYRRVRDPLHDDRCFVNLGLGLVFYGLLVECCALSLFERS